MLDRLQAANLLEAGVVNVIGLDAIRRKVGDRWPHKRAQIWEHVETVLERHLGPADIFFRTDDISYMITQPGAHGFAAQSICLSILQEVLRFFLGAALHADIDVRTVVSAAGGEVVSTPVDLSRLKRVESATPGALAAPAVRIETAAERMAKAVTGPLADHTPAAPVWKPPLAGRASTVELEPAKCEPFDMRLTVDAVWNLRRGLVTSFLIERGGVSARHQAAELEEIDVATFAYAAVLLEEQVQQGGPLTLHVPVSFLSLATLRTRQRLLALTQSVREAMRGSVLLEICGLDPGVPPSRLIDVVGQVRSLCIGVVARVKPLKPAIAAVRDCGLRAVAVEAEYLGVRQADFPARLKAFVAIARDVSPNLLVHGLRDPKQVDMATAAGFTHASVSTDCLD